MRYVIYGAGAVGGVIGGRLHAAGREVVLVARGAHLGALQRDGLHLATPDGEEHHRIEAVANPGELTLGPDDIVVLTVKSQHTAGAVADLAATASPSTPVVCAQNGVANERLALRFFRDVYGMCVILPSQHVEPGVVVQQSAPSAGVLDLGRYPSGTDERAGEVAADLRAASFRSDPTPAVMRNKYRKLLMNLGNALDALCGWEARSSDLYRRAQEEGEACFAAAGIDVQSADEEKERRTGGVTRREVPGHDLGGSSSWQSLARGAGSIETDWLNGEVVLLGRLHGVATPVNEALQHAAVEAARTGRPPGSVSLVDLEERVGAARQ
jgi:2-dehydropantoate 2-reductase